MTLPPEILDKILTHVPTHEWGSRTLIACALVTTQWTGPSQRRLFSSVKIYEGNRGRWMEGVVLSESKVHLLEYVRSLWLTRGPGYRMRDLAQDCGEYLPALYNLHNLTLSGIGVERISENQFHTCFSAFRGTLTYLFLNAFITSFGAFLTLVDYFPHIKTLRLRSLGLESDERPIPSLSRPFRGKLHVHHAVDHFQADFSKFYNRFANLNLEYEELVIESSSSNFGGIAFLESALQISPGTVRFLRLTTELQCERPLSVLISTTSLTSLLKLKPQPQRKSATFCNSKSWS